MTTKRTCGLPLICLVCGDAARGINFNVMSCMSCKTFFRRHSLKSVNQLQCLRQKSCEIMLQTRGDCSACRLEKCFTLGMNPKLVGKRFGRQTRPPQSSCAKVVQKKAKLPVAQISTVDLLENDRSTLTKDDWTLLSNIIHAYDATNIIPLTIDRLQQQASLPPKMRSKPSTLLDIVKYFYSTLQLVVERVPCYHILPMTTRKALVLHNSELFASINALFVTRETNAMDYPAFRTASQVAYSSAMHQNFAKLTPQLERNGYLVRIILVILAFAPSCGIVSFNAPTFVSLEFDSLLLLSIQNRFVTILWKFLLYQLGTVDAIRWFNNFVKYAVQIIQIAYEQQNVQHIKVLDTTIEDIVESLTMKD